MDDMPPRVSWMTARVRWSVVVICSLVLVISAGVSMGFYIQHQNELTAKRQRIADLVCSRQDDAIGVEQSMLALFEEAFESVPGAVQPQVTDEAMAQLARLRIQVGQIQASPCVPANP